MFDYDLDRITYKRKLEHEIHNERVGSQLYLMRKERVSAKTAGNFNKMEVAMEEKVKAKDQETPNPQVQ